MDAQNLDSVGHRRCYLRFSLRSLLGLFVVVALLIVAGQYVWPLRTVSQSIVSQQIDVQILKPHLDAIAQDSQVIISWEIDIRSNSIIVKAQAKNMAAAVAEIQQIVSDPSSLVAATSWRLSWPEIQSFND
jgi:hypothetical protein